MIEHNKERSISELICMQFGTLEPSDIADRMLIAEQAAHASMRLAEGIQGLGRLMTVSDVLLDDGESLKQAGLLVQEVSGIISSLASVTLDAVHSARDKQACNSNLS
ncbi:hypothetical protein [Craterilacuibacter sinensis]|uniref:Uncharacterized protein n=1 Tax=Craterilacuibacter sinensis TaxID=2686017 RepID=A0A845BW07_9NEIS|nr:hypothetical protein [Craterilacuibacter sinensis]MXR36693.1 hypothetical protein [Craterilacuibacter sinensis]